MLRYLDSFDHLDTADLPEKGWSNTLNISVSGGGRFGSCMVIGASNAPTSNTQSFDSQQTWIVGAAVRPGTMGSTDQVAYFYLLDSNVVQVCVAQAFDGTGRIVAYRGDFANQLGISSNNVLTEDVFQYVEMRVVISNTVGEFEVRVNGITVIGPLTGLDTQVTANASANQVRLGGYRSQGGSVAYDDLYICDGVDSGVGGIPNDDFLGDIRVQALLPNGNGNSSQFDGSDGNSTDNYLLVDESTQDGDTTYVQSSTAAEKDTYAYGDLTPTSGTVYGVQLLPLARKTDAGVRDIINVARHSGTEEDGPDRQITTSYFYYPEIREAKPGGGSWSIADVNAAEFGFKVG